MAQFHEDDPDRLRQQLDLAKSYVRLMHDCGGRGVCQAQWVCPGIPREKTIAQIGHALNELLLLQMTGVSRFVWKLTAMAPAN